MFKWPYKQEGLAIGFFCVGFHFAISLTDIFIDSSRCPIFYQWSALGFGIGSDGSYGIAAGLSKIEHDSLV